MDFAKLLSAYWATTYHRPMPPISLDDNNDEKNLEANNFLFDGINNVEEWLMLPFLIWGRKNRFMLLFIAEFTWKCV